MNLLLNYFIESTLAMTLVWLGYKLILEDLTFYAWNRFYILIGICLALILPIISIPVNWSDESVPIQVLSAISSDNLVGDPTVHENQTNWVSWSSLALMIYTLVSLVLANRLIYSIFSLTRKIQLAEKINYNGITLALDSSFTASSFFGKVLISPEQLSSNSIDQVIEHEAVHIKFGHSWDLIALQILKVFFWANPMIYLLEKSLKETHEFQADSKVIEQFPVIAYSRILVQNINGQMTSFIPSFNQFQTKKRIIMMNKIKSSEAEKSKFLLGVPLVLVMLLLFSCQIGGTENKVQGNWIGTDFKFDQTQGPDLAAMVEGGKTLHIDGKLLLKEDNTYQILDPSGTMNGQGIWALDGEVLRMTDEGQNVVEYQLVEVNNSALVTKHEVEMETPMGIVAGTILLTYSRE